MDSEISTRSGNATLEGSRSTRRRSFALLAFVLLSGSFSLANAQSWSGSGPFPAGENSRTVHALAIDPVTGTVYAGTASGTVFSLADATVSQPPEAFNDAAVTQPGIAIGVDVLANDVDPEDALEVTSVTLQAVPANGTAIVNSDGSVTYTPNGGFVGPDSFTYTVEDAAGNTSNAATVTVRVNGPPTAADDTAATLENEPVTVDVLANDADADGSLDPATVAVSNPPANGSAIAEADGRITYAPAVDFTGVDSFSYRVGDDDGGVSNVATVTVTVSAQEPPNTPPVANDDAATVMEGGSVTISVLANDNDADGLLVPATVTLQGSPGNGNAQVGAGGSIVYTPAAGFTGTDSFTYTVADDGGATSNAATVSVTVTAAGGGNTAPVAADDSASTEEGAPVDIDVLANDSDADGTLDATSVTLQATPADGTAEVNADGTVTYSPGAGFSGTDSFTYTVADDDGATSNAATVSVTVTAADGGNTAPVAADDSASTDEGVPVDIDVLANDGDADGTLDAATVTLQSDPADGTAEANADGTVTYTPDAGFAGTDSFTYTVQDDAGAGSEPATVTVTVNAAANPAPPPAGGGKWGGGGSTGLLWLAAMALVVLRRAGRAMRTAGPTSLFAMSALAAGSAGAEPLLYVSHDNVATVSVIDTATGNLVNTVTLTGFPAGAPAVSTDGRRLFVAAGGAVSVADTGMFDTAMSSIIGSIDTGSGSAAVAVAPDGSRAYVTNTNDRTVAVVDLGTNTVIDTVPVGNHPNAIALAPDGARAYVANGISGTVSVIDLASLDVNTITVGNGLQQIVISPDGTRAYVTSSVTDSVAVIDTGAGLVVSTIGDTDDFPTGVFGIAITPDGSRIYVTQPFDNSVSVIDTASESVVDTIGVDHFPWGIGVTPNGARAYVASSDDDTVSLIDTATNTVIGTPIAVADRPEGLTVGPAPAVTAVVTDPANPLALYAGTAGAGLYRSVDGGESWVVTSTGLTDLDITALAIGSNGSAVYAGTRANGVFKSVDDGVSWAPASNGLDLDVLSLHILSGDDQALFAGSDGGVYKTTDGGATWQAVNAGLP